MIIPVYGAAMEWSDDGNTWERIPKAKGVVVPEVSKDFREVTNLDSPDGYKEFVKGLKDGGEVTLSCFYSKELYAAASAKESSSTPTHIRVTFVPDEDQSAGDVFSYKAWITPSVPSADSEGDLMVDLKFRTTGGVAWTQGAAA